jgi:hypothetical protein
VWGERNLQEGEVRGEERGGGEGGNRQKGENLSKKREKSQRQKIVKTKNCQRVKTVKKILQEERNCQDSQSGNRQQRKPSTVVQPSWQPGEG